MAESLADRVPDGAIDRGAGHEANTAVAENVKRGGPRQFPAALGGEGVLAEQPRSDFVLDRALDLAVDVVFVAREDFAGDAFIRVDARDDGGTVRHLVVASTVYARQRDADRNRFDLADGKTPVSHDWNQM